MTRTAALRFAGAVALAAATVSPVTPSFARERWHHEGGWGGGHAWHGHHDCGGCGIAGALLGLALGAAIASGNEAPPPAYYSAPPPSPYGPSPYGPPPGVYSPPPSAAYPPPAVYYGDDE